MLAGLTAQLSRSHADPGALPFAPNAILAPERARGGVIWITGVAGVARTELIGAVRRQLEPSWSVETVAPEALGVWLQHVDEPREHVDEPQVAIVVANGAAGASADARRRVSAAELAFIEILAVSDWDALVERTDSTIFEHLADFFAHLGHTPAPRPRPARPDAVIRIDWHGPEQIKKRITDALQRAGLLGTERLQSSRHP